jgi:hypothetical protein
MSGEIEPIRLEVYFSLSHGFQRAWEETVTKAADQVMAEMITHPELIPADFLADMEINVPWPGGVIADPLSIDATFTWYTLREVTRRRESLGK